MARSICEKDHNSFPQASEETNFDFFKFPVWKEPRFEKYTIESLAQKFNGIENISRAILKEIQEGRKIHSSFEILEPHLEHAYAPTLKFMEKIATHYKQKYQIDIRFVCKKDAAQLIKEVITDQNISSVGIVIFGEAVFHVTPVIIYKGDPTGYRDVLIMDCTHRKKIKTVLTDLMEGLPENTRLLFANKTRLGGRYFCRMEAMSLLKYALLHMQRKNQEMLSSYLNIYEKKSSKEPRPFFDFEVPRQWAVGSNLTRAVRVSPAFAEEPINLKGETYATWQQRHSFTNARVRVTAMNEDESESCKEEFYKYVNLFLTIKVNKLVGV
jgi:hypothetical protein